MFILKKIISAFLLPFNVCVLFLAAGIILLFATGRQKLARAILLTGFVALLLLSTPPIANVLADSLENLYPAPSANDFIDPKLHWIVVLGGGHNSSMPAGQQLSGSSLARVVEGIRIFRMKSGRTLVLSGGSVYDPLPNAVAMAREAKSLGIGDKDMILETTSRDTEEEAQLLLAILQKDRFFLVTSAIHMPRAMAIFLKAGMNPIATPCDFSFVPQNPPALLRVLPNAASLQLSERAFRERMGMLYSRVRGKAQ